MITSHLAQDHVAGRDPERDVIRGRDREAAGTRSRRDEDVIGVVIKVVMGGS